METPHDRMMKHNQPRPSRFSDDYDESLEETIKAVRGNRTQRSTGVFEQMRQQAEAMAQQQSGHQRTNTMSSSYTDNSGMSAADFLDMTNMDQFVKIEGEFDDTATGNLNISHDSPPMHPHMASFTMNGVFDQKPGLHAHDSQETVRLGRSSAQSSRRASPHRRTESLASIVSAASISSINIEETKTDTGVSADEIQMYIEGPDAEAKWICTFEQCGKKFGRKENIKSHVQTHLNDRQYQCPTCKKCFVRQHDLKRHAKIHTGIKPYPCECGNSFARHDALTRHRQRGMCIGAFDGIVRKVVKRGRPRKYRPELEDRLEKSERTRRKIRAAEAGSRQHTSTPSSSSSHSVYSDSSAGNSPINDDDFNGVLDDAPFQDMHMMDVGAAASMSLGATTSRPSSTKTMSPATISSAFMPSSNSFEDSATIASPNYDVTSVSPGQITAASPSTMSNYSFHGLPTLPPSSSTPNSHLPAPASPAKSVTSSYAHNTPPELSASSSPPPMHSTAGGAGDLDAPPPRFFDLDDEEGFDPNVSGLSDHSIGLGTTAAAHAAACGRSGVGAYGGVGDDLLLQDIMMGVGSGKYFDDVDEVALFNGSDDVDVFFGSS
jgi:regulatory protein SWI5